MKPVVLVLSMSVNSFGETVAGYRADFSTNSMPQNWLYLWNELGTISKEVNFASLEVDPANVDEWQPDGTNGGRPDPGQGGYLRLSSGGACAGYSDPDTYAIAGYEIQTAGRYFIQGSFLQLNSTNSSGVDLRVFVNSDAPLRVDEITSTNQFFFDTDLGLLHSGDTVYVALGPGSDPVNDYCWWDFSIDRQDPWYSSGYPDPEEVPVNTVRPLNALNIFNAGQPRPFSFRSDYLSNFGYSIFSNTISQSFGHAPKTFGEERLASSNNLPLMVQYAQDRPDQMVLCHYNLKQIKVMQYEEFADFFPGHWLYYPGSVLTQAVGSNDTVLTVASAGNVLEREPLGSSLSNSVVALIPLDEHGARLWAQTEYAAVVSKSGNSLTVERGLLRTTAADYPAGTYVAVLPDLYLGEADMSLRFNWSADCPLDAQGRNCGDVFVAMMADYFSPGGPLEKIHGILSDVLFWELGDPVSASDQLKRKMDADGDGLADNGYDDAGINRFALGVYDMVRKLRTALGPDRIISADGNGEQWPRLPHLFNGMESEGLAHWNDPYAKDWSSNLNLFRYWKAHPGFDCSLSYIVDKLPTLTDEELAEHQIHLQRLAGAVAAILDIEVTANGVDKVTLPDRRYELYDHLRQGVVERLGWLGEPDGWMRPATNFPNLFAGSVGDWTSSGATLADEAGEWHVQSSTDVFGPSSESMTVTYSGQSIPSGDLFVRFLARADSLTWFPSNVYRYVTVTVDGRQANANTADELTGIASADGYTECCFYYRDAGPATVDINVTFEGPQDAWIKDFSIHNATDVFVRGFENGVVLANPKNEPYTFDLSKLFPGRICWRLTAHEWEDPETNSGMPVGDLVTVPALDGLFLRSEPDTDDDGLSDRWELSFASDLSVLDGSGDTDGDGASDAEEHLAGTNPLNADSIFALGLPTIGNQSITIQWPGVADHRYTLWWTGTLGDEWLLFDTIDCLGSDAVYLKEYGLQDYGLENLTTGFFKIRAEPF